MEHFGVVGDVRQVTRNSISCPGLHHKMHEIQTLQQSQIFWRLVEIVPHSNISWPRFPAMQKLGEIHSTAHLTMGPRMHWKRPYTLTSS